MRIISGTLRPTQLSWLPVLSNIAPPDLRRKSAASNFLPAVEDNPKFPVFQDIYNHPKPRLKSRHPIWLHNTPVYTEYDSWKKLWEENPPANSFLVDIPSEKVPGFGLPRREWVTLNRFRTGVGRCAANLQKWGYQADGNCECGEVQTMNHFVNDCSLNKLQGGLNELHSSSEAAVSWLTRANCIR